MHRSVERLGSLVAAGPLALLLAVAVSACGLIGRAGEGPLTSETRPVTGLSRVDASNGIGVTVQIGQTTSVEVSAQANILPIIATTVEGGTLKIRSTEGFSASAGVGVTVVMPVLDAITLSGGSQGVVEGITADRFEITMDGGANLTASGRATTITLRVSGGAVARLESLTAQTVNLQVSGGANVTVRASAEVAGTADGGARDRAGRRHPERGNLGRSERLPRLIPGGLSLSA